MVFLLFLLVLFSELCEHLDHFLMVVFFELTKEEVDEFLLFEGSFFVIINGDSFAF